MFMITGFHYNNEIDSFENGCITRGRRNQMARFHAVTWQDGSFDSTASILSFNSKKARAAFPAQCVQRVESIDSKKKAALLRSGYIQRLVLWDESDPHNFRVCG